MPMIDELLLPLVEAVHRATGRRPHLSTALRWCTKERCGIRLESRILGGRRLTSPEAVLRYMEAVTRAKDGEIAKPSVSPRQQSIAANQAAKKLAQKLNPIRGSEGAPPTQSKKPRQTAIDRAREDLGEMVVNKR